MAIHVSTTRAGWACIDRIADRVVNNPRYGATSLARFERATIIREYSRVVRISSALATCEALALDPDCYAWEYGESLPELPR